ncbi:hypothetical protein [Polynucleobacter sp. JS-JIR-5-A7]|uniref:hypothetical protein n=1 Tax=Polynucleobacter sp. JS-JIR-5-A7 TaxID=1758395 RepID=UPI001BFD4E99|nr:hypothetical protein [Polynucleobacter sp. JS-JIR-5-A7]QWE06044.1 hypothetical protein AOC29_07955 [Polynucleobacter sp. JS-JIR-5-A7]
MKKFLFALALLGLVQSVNAKVITLSCDWINLKGGTNTTDISMDTDLQVGSATTNGKLDGTGKLYSDGEDYWFTAKDLISRQKYQVNRNTLSMKLSYILDSGIANNSFQGQCKQIVKAQPKI